MNNKKNSFFFHRQFLQLRNRLRFGLPAQSERRLSGPETRESPPRSGRSPENHRFRIRQKADRQVMTTIIYSVIFSSKCRGRETMAVQGSVCQQML